MNQKKIWNRAWLLCICFMVLLCTIALAAKSSQKDTEMTAETAVMDEAGILQSSEVQSLTQKIHQVEKAHGVRIGVYVTKQLPQGVTAGKLANQMVDTYYADGKNGGIVLVLAMKSRDWYVSTNNEMRKRITDEAGFPYLKEQFLPDLKDGKYASAFGAYVDGVDKMMTYYEKEEKPYDPFDEFNLMAFLVAIVVAVLGGWLVRSILISSMSNVMHAVEAGTYLKRESVRLTMENDTFLFTNVTRVAKSKSRDSDTSSRDSSHGGGGGKF